MSTPIINEEMQIITQEAEVKYFHQMLNMAEDELDQPEYRLLGHYLRWAGHGGMEQEGIRQTATRCHMGTDMVEKTREALVAKGYLKVIKPSDEERKNGVATKVIVVDRWMENYLYCQKKYGVSPVEDTSTPDSLSQPEGGVPEQVDSEYSQTPCIKKSTSLSTGVAVERVSDPEPEAKDDEVVDLFGAIPKVEPMPNIHRKTIAAASEPTTPYRAIVSPVVEEEVVVEPAVKPKTKRPRKEGVTPAECINPMKAAIMKAFGWSWKGITNTEKGQVYNAAKQLCDVNFPVGEIQDLYDFCAEKFDDFGPMALTKHQSDYRKEHRPQNIAPELLGPQKKVVPPLIRSAVRQGWDKIKELGIDLAFWEIDPSEVGRIPA